MVIGKIVALLTMTVIIAMTATKQFLKQQMRLNACGHLFLSFRVLAGSTNPNAHDVKWQVTDGLQP